MPQTDWTFAEIWNNSLLTFTERPLTARDYMWATDIGGPFIDRYLKMLGTKPTNPPNNRSLRKFQAGNIWEWIVGYVLQRAGILKKRQVRASVEIPGCLRVSGKMDFIAGGEMDWDRAEYEVNQLGLPEFIEEATRRIIEQLKKLYKDKELLVKIQEVKSTGAFVIERIISSRKGNPNHLLQNYHYLIGNKEGIDVGCITYVCRDDCRIAEVPVYKESPHLQAQYEEDVRTMSEYYIHKELPPPEELIIFDEDACRFTKNWKVEYSYYLTKIYKFKSPQEYIEKYGKMVLAYNATLKRCVESKKLTDLNKTRIKEIKKLFPEYDRYVVLARNKGLVEVEEDEIEIAD